MPSARPARCDRRKGQLQVLNPVGRQREAHSHPRVGRGRVVPRPVYGRGGSAGRRAARTGRHRGGISSGRPPGRVGDYGGLPGQSPRPRPTAGCRSGRTVASCRHLQPTDLSAACRQRLMPGGGDGAGHRGSLHLHRTSPGGTHLEPITAFKGGAPSWATSTRTRKVIDGITYPTAEGARSRPPRPTTGQSSKPSPLSRRPRRPSAPAASGEELGHGRAIPGRLGGRQTVGDEGDLALSRFADPELRRVLATGDALVEGNAWNDTFWGVCRGRGQDHLGRLLEGVREKFVAAGGGGVSVGAVSLNSRPAEPGTDRRSPPPAVTWFRQTSPRSDRRGAVVMDLAG